MKNDNKNLKKKKIKEIKNWKSKSEQKVVFQKEIFLLFSDIE